MLEPSVPMTVEVLLNPRTISSSSSPHENGRGASESSVMKFQSVLKMMNRPCRMGNSVFGAQIPARRWPKFCGPYSVEFRESVRDRVRHPKNRQKLGDNFWFDNLNNSEHKSREHSCCTSLTGYFKLS